MIYIVLQLQAGWGLPREFSMKRCTSNIHFIVNKAGLVLLVNGRAVETLASRYFLLCTVYSKILYFILPFIVSASYFISLQRKILR